MFPLQIATYVKMGLCLLLLGGAWYSGYHFEHTRFVKFQDDVREAADKQKAEVESIQKQHELVTKGISNEYDAKLALVRQYYANGVRQPNGSGAVSGISTTSSIANERAAYNQLAEQCTETTLQLEELKAWINAQAGVK